MQQALEALEKCAVDIENEWGIGRELEEMRKTGEYTPETTPAIHALRAALAESVTDAWRESASDYERGVIDGMAKQAESSVDRAVNVISRKPLTDEEVVALFNRLCQERSAWPERRYRDFARWVERAHGIGDNK